MKIEFLTKYPGGHCSALAHTSGRTFNFICAPDGSLSAINERLASGKWYTLRPKQALKLAAEIEQAVAHKMGAD